MGYSLWGCKESDPTKQLTHTQSSYSALKPPGNWRMKSFTKIAPVLGLSPLSPSSNTGAGGLLFQPRLTHVPGRWLQQDGP